MGGDQGEHALERGWHVAEQAQIREPFLMTIVGGSNHWMFVSSTGALTAGRTNAEEAIFSYETEDRLHRAAGRVGPVVALWIEGQDGREVLWRPFDTRRKPSGVRTVAKRTLGDGVRFAEHHEPSGLSFEYEWQLSEAHGFVRRCRLRLGAGAEPVRVRVVDGLRGVLPHGVESATQMAASVLVDAYKRSEILSPEQVGVYSLTARIVDRPEAAESLRCTVAYQHGLDGVCFLDAAQFDDFCERGAAPEARHLLLGRAAGYFVYDGWAMAPGDEREWLIGVDIGWEGARVVELGRELGAPGFSDRVDDAVAANREALRGLVARADGLQASALRPRADRHATNVMFNCMRGGVIETDELPVDDVRDFFESRNREVARRHRAALDGLDAGATRGDLLALARRSGDADFVRLAVEYMPLSFSRRHGDPSRPWNTFNIHLRREDGSRRFYFEGNWRDVFQNWEALLASFPAWAEAGWTMFLNATTADGYNPYRITREGVDWERPDPDDPWAHIGYWGDHQIIYLLKLLELYDAHAPGVLADRLNEANYVFADVPYRIADYEAIVANPHDTITFDRAHDRAIGARREAIGGDGNLLHASGESTPGVLVRATLAEKLLISVLAKLSNFVAEGGIWMNTQRPEWNDANNALVGHGLSVVTLAYLVRHLGFLEELFGGGDTPLKLHEAVADWLDVTREAFQGFDPHAEVDDATRRGLLDRLGRAAAAYRGRIYAGKGQDGGLGELRSVERAAVARLLAEAHEALSASLRACRRADGLFHGYNLMKLGPQSAAVEHLPVMLEGQVAALSAGALSAEECVELVDTLYQSELYRADQHSFLLYPAVELPGFLARGVLDAVHLHANGLLLELLARGDRRLVSRDADDVVRFAGSLRNAGDVERMLDALALDPELAELVGRHRAQTLAAWEAVFNHHAYTGRSGSMYGYEGLGSIYWHMVSKLNLAMLENALEAHDEGASSDTLGRMADAYYRLRAGLGDAKTFEEYGAFPTDAYSHTPPGGGARQPGMTGQVKEDILARRGELGVRVVDGRLRFEPVFLEPDEFLDEPRAWEFIGVGGERGRLALDAGQLAFTVCQVPVVYTLVEGDGVACSVTMADGRSLDAGEALAPELSRQVFARCADVRRVDVRVGRDGLLLGAGAPGEG